MKHRPVIPDGWSAHHAPIAEGFMTAECRIHDADTTGSWPNYEPVPGSTYYPRDGETGICSVQAFGTGSASVVFDVTVTAHTYMVSIPLPGPEVPIGEGSPFITITACPDDPKLVGKTLTITAEQFGSTNWTREFICNLGEG